MCGILVTATIVVIYNTHEVVLLRPVLVLNYATTDYPARYLDDYLIMAKESKVTNSQSTRA